MLSKLMTRKEQLVLVSIAVAVAIGAMGIYVRETQNTVVPRTEPKEPESLPDPTIEDDFRPMPAHLPATTRLKPSAPTEDQGSAELVISIAGAVEEPGVYHLGAGARVEDLINRAGGLAQGADVRAINRAARLVDGTTLTIPFGPFVRSTGDRIVIEQRAGNSVLNHPQYRLKGWLPDASEGSVPLPEAETPLEVQAEGVGDGDSLVDVNHATVAELKTLPGIGPALARRIFDFVKEHPIHSLEELDDVDGIGEGRLESMRNKIIIR